MAIKPPAAKKTLPTLSAFLPEPSCRVNRKKRLPVVGSSLHSPYPLGSMSRKRMAFSKLTNCWKFFYDWSKNDETSPAKKPSLVYSIGPCGGTGGEANNMAANPNTRILKMMVRHGGLMVAVRIMYLHDGVSKWTDWWGGSGGQSSEIFVEDNEYLTCVSGHYSNFTPSGASAIMVIRSLSLVTNKRTYGPYGEEQGIPFKLDAQGGKIVGFFGRSGKFLDAIGIYTAPQ